MREWSKEERYKPLESIDDIKDLEEKISKSKFRQCFHIQPRTGLLNDPNGFVYDDDTKTWHMFYQWFPWGAAHGLKYWYHVTSKDLVHWGDAGIGISPDSDMDNKGAYSGSAIKDNGEIYFFYTGNHRDENWVRTAYTCLAKLGKDNKVYKFDKPVFGPSEDYSEHQRDPKIFYDEKLQKYFIIIGARSKDDRGCLLLYESDKLTEGWAFKGEIKVEGYESFGKMWECPSIEKIGDKYIFIFSPQFIEFPDRGSITNHNVYLIGDFDVQNMIFKPEGDFGHLDLGFDFYAAACAANTEKPVLSAWMGLPDAFYYTDEEDWSGCLILPRELSIEGGKLKQRPVKSMFDILKKEIEYKEVSLEELINIMNTPENNGLYEIQAPAVIKIATANQGFTMGLLCDESKEGGISLSYSQEDKTLKISKALLKHRINPEFGEERVNVFEDGLTEITCFIDKSSIEIFFNDGDQVFTTRIFPEGEKYIAFRN
ncbi:MAG: sucrose-6-phosphate hydrolase [Lachnospiraceae bacterium]|nr:sucrose-6-phosphate hydrolase [Lachnospiraceae bacterium]